MRRPIPVKILKSAATVKVCNGVDRYQNQTYTVFELKRVHLQPTNEIRKTQTNTEVVLRSILFVDAQTSTPRMDWCDLLQGAHEKGGDVRIIVRGVEYTLLTVDELRDDTDQVHHWELGLC